MISHLLKHFLLLVSVFCLCLVYEMLEGLVLVLTPLTSPSTPHFLNDLPQRSLPNCILPALTSSPDFGSRGLLPCTICNGMCNEQLKVYTPKKTWMIRHVSLSFPHLSKSASGHLAVQVPNTVISLFFLFHFTCQSTHLQDVP